MANLCNINGQIVPEADGRVPVLDRGFLFGDSVYEVVRTHAGTPLAWIEHWARLQASAAGLMMELDLDEATVARIMDVAAAGGDVETMRREMISENPLSITVEESRVEEGLNPVVDAAYAELGIDRMILNVNFGSDPGATRDSLHRFAEEVMPRVGAVPPARRAVG